MRIEDTKIGDVFVVIPMESRIDASVSSDFKEKMVGWISEGHHRIVLDLNHVDFIDSSGLGAIVATLKALGGAGDLVICNVKETIMGLFKLTRMNRTFQFYSSQNDAVKELTV